MLGAKRHTRKGESACLLARVAECYRTCVQVPPLLPLPPAGAPPSHAYVVWLLGQSVAVVILVAWILTLLRERTASRLQSERQSNALLQAIENGWRERWRDKDAALLQLDSAQRNLLSHFTELAKRPGG